MPIFGAPFYCALMVLAFGASACADEPSADLEPDGPLFAIADLESKADGATGNEIRVRAGNMTLGLTVRAKAEHAGPNGS